MDKGSFGFDYRRGLVLGLTLAEVFLLLLFLLLLVFSYLLSEHEQIRAEQEQKWQNVSDSFETFGLPHETPEDIRQSMKTLSETMKTLSETMDNPKEIIESSKAYKEIKEVLKQNGVRINDPNEIVTRLKEMTEAEIRAKQYKQVCGDLEKVKKLLKNLHGQDATAEGVVQQCPATIENPNMKLPQEQAPETLADAEKIINRLRRTNASLRDRLIDITGGRGADQPPCWVKRKDPNRQIYTYDISIKDTGLVVKSGDDRTGQDLSVLAVNGPEPEFDKTISPERFQTRTKGMFDWSDDNGCRFFVRISDKTSDTNKAGYKASLASIEKHFYKYLKPN